LASGQQELPLASSSLAKDKGVLTDKDTLCFRCNLKVHLAIECNVVLCIFCDSALHKDGECPLHAMPKPTAVMYGLCRESLLFMDVPKTPDL
jgi:hypothetical protein